MRELAMPQFRPAPLRLKSFALIPPLPERDFVIVPIW